MNLTVIILCIVGGLWVLGVFVGYIGSMGKSFQKNPATALQSSTIKKKQSETAEETRLKQQEYMDSIKQKISDNSRK